MITLGKRQRSPQTSIKTVLEIDLYSYNDIATFIEENLDVAAVKAFEIRFIDSSIAASKQLVCVVMTLFLGRQATMRYGSLMMPLQCTDFLKQFTEQL